MHVDRVAWKLYAVSDVEQMEITDNSYLWSLDRSSTSDFLGYSDGILGHEASTVNASNIPIYENNARKSAQHSAS